MACWKTGAIVEYCGHNATFRADIWRFAGAVVIRANGPIREEILTRPAKGPRYLFEDHPDSGFWRPDLGIFVIPETQFLRWVIE